MQHIFIMSKEKKSIIGSWILKEFKLHQSETDKWEDWGANIVGLLIYSNDGYMSASIVKNSQTKFDPIKDVLFYSGKFELENKKIIHFVSVATNSERINKEMIREYTINDNELILSGTSDSGRKFKLVWIK
jgi:hypothetical protein